MTTLHQVFKQLNDPRINRSKKHLLIDIIILSIPAVLREAESYDSIELFGKTNYEYLKQFLKLPRMFADNFAKLINSKFICIQTKKEKV